MNEEDIRRLFGAINERLEAIEQRLDAMDLQIASLEEAAYNPKQKQLLTRCAA